ncbi:hypothetical protein SAMN05877838_3938 [Hoeflea halophila]|uniref:Uncharacterized protein n=1 Tax=Hoeflea halophila TaxID=714899 RepID=A0A286IFT1_9HYPH|nr:hypothetical protein [Hoeflea halophila]SOE18988.1 hypothetical protein SAMN05877838_3938 [Hoeflea halophila]
MQTGKPHETAAPEQKLRADIDSGRTGEKVDASDPATVPLGTDAEAGGIQTDRAAASRARHAELDGPGNSRRRAGKYLLIFPGVVVLIAVLLAILVLR